MKKILFIAFSVLTLHSVRAQEPSDALRYSWYVPGASARIKAVGGAMGSLGGDMTATFVNPAGLAFYKTGDFMISPAYQFGKMKTNYLGFDSASKTNKFTWGTTGFVIGDGNNSKSNVRNSALSIVYNRTADFNSHVVYKGKNTESSYSQKYLEEIKRDNVKDGNTLTSAYPFGSSLAFNTFWIDTVGGSTNGNFEFQSRSAKLLSTGLLQQNDVQTTGGIDEFALGLAVNLKDKIMIGGSFGVPVLHYKRVGEFIEADATRNHSNQFEEAIVDEELQTNGVGMNLRMGVIYKPKEYWRLGLAVHSPTLYTLTDKYQTSVTADLEDGNLLTDYSIDYTDGKPSEFKYTYVTPYKVIGSVSYVIREIQDVTKQRGFLTADVEYVNYKASSFSADDEENTDQETKNYLKTLNKAIDNAYKGAFNFRAGGELKFTTLMVRLGAAYYGNPYKDVHGEKGSKLNLSGGLGYRNKGFFADLTYVHAINKDVNYAYRLQNSPYSGANLKNSAGNVFLTVGVKI
ncbi:MAG: OmpP1/FadL family transporter [Flavisolibacter sp.]